MAVSVDIIKNTSECFHIKLEDGNEIIVIGKNLISKRLEGDCVPWIIHKENDKKWKEIPKSGGRLNWTKDMHF